MDEVVVVEKPEARQPSRQGSLRLRALAPGSINVVQAGVRSAGTDCHDAEVIPLLTPLHDHVPGAPAESTPAGRMTAAAAAGTQHAEVVAAGRRCAAVEKTRLPAWWWHPAMPPFVSDQPVSSSSSSVGFRFQNCV